MGGKKTVEDSRRFEKDRRDKLNAAFEELCKLLPDHDPLVTLSKMEILKKAAQYIKQLQDQNEEIMKLGSDSVLKTESERLRKRVTHLLLKTKELVDALRSAGVPIPSNKKKRKKKVTQNIPSNQNQIVPDKQLTVQTSKEAIQTVKKVKCGCMKASPEKKPLKESNPTATTLSSSVGNVPAICSDSTSGQPVISGTNLITVAPPMIGAPILATKMQNVPLVSSSALAANLSSNSPIIPNNIVPLNNSAIYEGITLNGNTNAMKSNHGSIMTSKLPTSVIPTPTFVKELVPQNLNNKAIPVVTAASSNIITTQSFVNSTQILNLPPCNGINNPVVAPRIQNVPAIEKSILSNLGPGTLILSDGRIVNVPPIVPQIVVKPQPAVILMPTAKKKEKLLIPKKREVTETTFANKAPIPAIQTFRLESFPRVRPKKKPNKPLKKVEKKIGGNIESEQMNKKRKLDKVSQSETLESAEFSENKLQEGLLQGESISNVHSEGTKDKGSCENVTVSSDNSTIEPSDNIDPHLSDCCSNPSQTSCSQGKLVTSGVTSSLNSSPILQDVTSSLSSSGEVLATTTSGNPLSYITSSLTENVGTATSKQPEENLTLVSVSSINDVPLSSQKSDSDSSSSIFASMSSTLSASNSDNQREASITDGNDSLDVTLSQESVSKHVDTPANVCLSTSIDGHTSVQSDNSIIYDNHSRHDPPCNEVLTNLPSCVSSSKEQDSVYDKKIDQQGQKEPEITKCSLSGGSIVKQVCSDVENSVSLSNKEIAERKTVVACSEENQELSSPSHSGNTYNEKNSPLNGFNKVSPINQNIQTVEDHLTEISITETGRISDLPNREFINTSVNDSGINEQNINSISDLAGGPERSLNNNISDTPVHLNSGAVGRKEQPHSPSTTKEVYSQPRTVLNQPTPCSNDTITSCPLTSTTTVSTSQNVCSSSQEKDFTHLDTSHERNLPKTSNLVTFPNYSSYYAVPHTQNSISADSNSNSQISLHNHSSYRISSVHPDKELLLFNSVYKPAAAPTTNEKNSSVESSLSNALPVYSSSTYCTSETVSNNQSTFNLKHNNNPANMLPSSGGRNVDVYSGFNQAFPTQIGDKPFYPQNVSFSHNSLSRPPHWDKPQCNKSPYINNFGGEACEDQNLKLNSTYERNKNGLIEKQNEHTQSAYFSFQNEPVTSHSNTFFHGLSTCSTTIPLSCSFSDSSAVFPYHSNPTSVVSTYSIIPHENITSFNRSSTGGMKSIHQDRSYLSNIPNIESSKSSSFRNNEKVIEGSIAFYPSSSQAVSTTYSNSVQSVTSSGHSSFSHTKTSSSYSSTHMSTSVYPTVSQYNVSTYSNSVNHSTSSMYTSAHPISSSVYTNLSQSSSYSTPQLNTTNVFTRPSQPPPSSNTYCIPTHQNVSNVKNASSSSSYLNSNQHHASSIYTNSTQSNMTSSTQTGTSSAYISSVQSMYSSPSQSAAPTVNSGSVQHNNYSKSTLSNLPGIHTSTPLHTSDSSSNVSRVYTGTTLQNIPSIYTSTAPSITHAYTTPIQASATSLASRYNTCVRSVAESPMYQSDSSKPIQSSENSGCISLSNFNTDSTVVLNNTKTSTELTNRPSSVSSKKTELVATDNPTFSDVSRSKESNKPNQTESSLNEQRPIKPMETSYLQDKDVPKNKYPSSDLPLVDKMPSVSERNIFNINLTEKEHPNSQIVATPSKPSKPTEKERTADIDKYTNYNFVPSKGKDIQNKRVDINTATTKSNETNEKSVQSNVNNSTDKISESNSFVPNTNQKSVSTEVSPNNVNYNYSSQTSSSYQQIIQPQNNNFSSISASVQTKPYSNCNSSGCDSLNQYNTKSVPNTLNAGGHSKEGASQPSHPLPPSGNTGNSAEQLSKGSLVDLRGPEKQDKSIQKSYETTVEGNHLKITSDVTADFLKAKDIERNTFIPIIDDVRLSTDFSTDLFSSLQVPAGGSHSESISPTAAFLLAFPLVSTSRNIESLHDNENHENHTSTPTTILQIGNIEPPSTELFHPIDFQKGSTKSADHFDINNDYLQVGDLHEKQNQTIYKRCEKRKDTFTDYGKEMRPTDPKQKSNQQQKSAVPTTNTYTQSYSQPLLACTEYQYCEKDSSQWQQEFSSNTSKEQKKTCDRKKDKVAQKSCFNQNYQEYYNYKDKKRKQQNRISVNWMTTPENREPTDYPNKEPETVNNLIGPPSQSLYSGMSLDFPGEPFPEFCNAKKPNNYSWSPSKSLLPTLDNHLMIPSTLPTLVGDLALGTSTPSETYKTYDMPKTQPQPQGHMTKKSPEKLDVNKKQSEFSKSQANFFSVSQLVDHKSKKQKSGERNYKRLDKNSKSRNNINCPKRKDDHCMYYEDRNNFITNQNQYSDKRHTYKGGSYSAESLIGVQHNEIDFSSSFNYQQNTNYFQGEFPHTVESSSQQYGYFQQTPFSGFNHDECQEFGFNSNQRVLDNSRQKNSLRKDDNYQVTASLLQPQLCPPYTKSMNYNLPSSHINTNTTSTLTNFNLSTIFPEMNDQRVGTSVQAPQQMNSSYPNSQNYRSHLS